MGVPSRVASTVLIADDDADIRALVATILTRAGFHAAAVNGGVPALAAARQERANLYVLDVRMPDMNGLELCRELKADQATANPVLLISAESSPDDIAAGYAAGCDDYLPKPFTSSELIRRVDHLLAREAEE
jgi:two-component system, OmpR family, phosphate regulon response regulator PhoB